jgi:hypothetical protein
MDKMKSKDIAVGIMLVMSAVFLLIAMGELPDAPSRREIQGLRKGEGSAGSSYRVP